MMVRIFDKMKSDRKKLILSEADKFIKLNTIWWIKKIYQQKFVQYVKGLLFGARNGSLIGIE